jgi:hypothetical protein
VTTPPKFQEGEIVRFARDPRSRGEVTGVEPETVRVWWFDERVREGWRLDGETGSMSHGPDELLADRTWDAELLTGRDAIAIVGEHDTLDGTVKAALAEARDLDVEDADLVVYKTTRKRGRVRDRSYWIDRNPLGGYRATATGA